MGPRLGSHIPAHFSQFLSPFGFRNARPARLIYRSIWYRSVPGASTVTHVPGKLQVPARPGKLQVPARPVIGAVLGSCRYRPGLWLVQPKSKVKGRSFLPVQLSHQTGSARLSNQEEWWVTCRSLEKIRTTIQGFPKQFIFLRNLLNSVILDNYKYWNYDKKL